MPKSVVKQFLFSTAITLISVASPHYAHATSTSQAANQLSSISSHFEPRTSKSTRLDFDTWDFMLSETVLYMGPSTRRPASKSSPQTGTRIPAGNTSRYKMEANKVLYNLMDDVVNSEMKSYTDELIALGNRLDIPSLPKNEQLAYWINLHNAVLITTIANHYPGPKRRPSLIEPVAGSDAKLHDAKLFEINGYKLSLRDIREEIVFPNWRNKDVPYAFHLGYLGSPSMSNVAYTGAGMRTQLANNADEFVNSLRGYENGRLSPYIREVAPWYYPGLNEELDSYFQQRMRPEVYAEYKSQGINESGSEDLSVADITGGRNMRSGVGRFYSNVQVVDGRSTLGPDVEQFLRERNIKNLELGNTDWFKRGTVTIIDTPTEDGQPSEIE